MKFGISSKTKNDKYIYGNFSKKKGSKNLLVFLSGFSGGQNLPLFKTISKKFLEKNISILRLNFCNDIDDKIQNRNALSLQDMSFSVYVKELKNILDNFSNNYGNIIFIGHSFGAVVSILFLNKYKTYIKKSKLVLWEPTLLPWKKVWMEEDFSFDKKRNLYFDKNTKEPINSTFYNECIRTKDSSNKITFFPKEACIISAENSADEDAKKYFSKLQKKNKSVFLVIKNTDHVFSGKNAQEKLFKTTSDFISLT